MFIFNIILLALIDSINPCVLMIMTIFLANLLLKNSKKETLIGAILFILTIYIIYFLYGLGILKVVNLLSNKTIIILVNFLLLIMILAEFNGAFIKKEGFFSMEMPLWMRKYAKKYLKIKTFYASIPIAIILSVFLLPCSSGPYLTALLMLKNTTTKYLILLIYNFFFVLPMILITILILYFLSPKKILKWKEKNVQILHLISFFLLIFILIYFNYINFKGITNTQNNFNISNKNNSTFYLIYLPTCEHCQNLEAHINKSYNVYKIPYLSNSFKNISSKLKAKNWTGGVPLLICYINKSKSYYLLGFPAKGNMNNGYFNSKTSEINMCENLNGKSIPNKENYKYCILTNGFYLGNIYSLNKMEEYYKKGLCHTGFLRK